MIPYRLDLEGTIVGGTTLKMKMFKVKSSRPMMLHSVKSLTLVVEMHATLKVLI